MLKPGRALELGAGHGTEAIFLASHGWEVVAVERSRAAVEESQRRVQRLSGAVRRRLTLIKGDATTFSERSPGSFDMVVERLLYQNLFRNVDAGQLASAKTYTKRRRGLILGAAYALKQNGFFVMRTRTRIGRWGRVALSNSMVTAQDFRLAGKYFDVGNEVGFRSVVTPWNARAAKFVSSHLDLSVLVLRRNEEPCP
ncbi:class I SAM-dependent methyltransferase [Myxococcus sp. K15C18031901]|uniref:class I SAM-dependent methyltransferase n=1 Tax=Myxococcus dinghuensis TaxID=2906761 RepID=UPI0020A7F1CC|nr:class I SAM-dependent methyltransferase [Myxococcus dinghuensis]MCP3104225.1 class I SAM-dependent methyltransferase [Myxococcus dinghuensis]